MLQVTQLSSSSSKDFGDFKRVKMTFSCFWNQKHVFLFPQERTIFLLSSNCVFSIDFGTGIMITVSCKMHNLMLWWSFAFPPSSSYGFVIYISWALMFQGNMGLLALLMYSKCLFLSCMQTKVSSGWNVKRLQEETEIKIQHLKDTSSSTHVDAISMLLKHVTVWT